MRAGFFRAAAALLALLSPSLCPADPGALALQPGDPSADLPPIFELGDGVKRVDALSRCLVAYEDSAGGAPSRLAFYPDRGRFKSVGPLRRPVGGAKAVWLCFGLRGASSTRSWFIYMGPNRGETVSLYATDSRGMVESMIVAPEQPSSSGMDAPPEYMFRITMAPGELKTVYVRMEAEGPLRARAIIWDPFEYIKTDELETCVVGITFGVIIAFLVYALLIAFSLRESAYAYYLLYLFAFLVLVLYACGAGQSVFWPGSPWWGKRAGSFSLVAMDCGIALFARGILGARRKSPAVSRVLVAVAVGSAFPALALVAFDLRVAAPISTGFDCVARVAVLVSSFLLVGSSGGYDARRAKFFSLSLSLATAGCVAARLGELGLVAAPSTLWSSGLEYGVVAQILVFSYGMTDSINEMRDEKDEGQRRLIESLERANRVKEDFVIGMSLEFRSPLFGIIGLVDATEGLGDDGAEKERLASLVKAEAVRLLGSVANIASYARLRNGDLAVVAERVNLKQVVEAVVSSSSHVASGKNLAIETSVDDVSVGTDERVFEQIVYILFADALKRSSSGIVRISGASTGGRVRVSVSDSAPPLSEELLSRFRSTGGPADPQAVGPGLELLVARLLAERLGGTLSYSRVEDRRLFSLDLPAELRVAADHRAEVRPGALSFLGRLAARIGKPVSVDLSESPPGVGSRGTILAFDEDPVFLEALKRYLESRGYAVAPTLSADKAVALSTSRSFDLVLLDASSQGRSGLSACSRIRATRGMDELPIVLMTDRESAEAVEAAFRAGASDYLPKLSPKELLFARVDTHVSLKRAVGDALETRRRIAELEKLKTLGVLAAGVAHEINTPNNAVIRNLPVISEVWREFSPSVRRLSEENSGFSVRGWSAEELLREFPELIADTYHAGLQIKKIVEDLKDYARDTSSSPPEPVDLSTAAAYASRLLAPLISRSTKRFVLDAPPGLPRVMANSQKLTQVAVSILENALQALPGADAGVCLRTFFEPGAGHVVLECEDEGAGIPPAVQGKVFEPFFTTKRDAGGTGLGLSVALGIVRDAGGDIAIDSQPGRGTKVRVLLPAISGAEHG